jgi:hypothetical protein
MSTRDPDNERLVAALKAELDASVVRLDGPIRTRLGAARRRAVAAAGQRAARRRGWGWMPAAALAALCGAVVGITLLVRFAPPVTAGPSAQTLELLADAVPVELLEDLEFYEWLAAGEDDAS